MGKYEKLDIRHEDLVAVNEPGPENEEKMEGYYQRIAGALHPVDDEDVFTWSQYIAHLQELSDNPFRLVDGGDTYETPTWYFHYTWKSDGSGTVLYVPKEVKFWEQMQKIIKDREESLTHAVQGYLPSWSYDEEGARVWMLYESAKCMSGHYELYSEGCGFVIGEGKCDAEIYADGYSPYSRPWSKGGVGI